ncbi:hypothetical protein [Rhizobium phaseoli]|uniref:hypothetical protein n=1 Tax=Rhizobium phaseoli TaxID=396 RepID=UPI002554D903|nr:hypothetical protein [Rhizobium phaseoli]MDK4730519.1 hypothetical protein [Rhizobium phaseoli]
MTMNIHFDTGSMSREEASALGVLLASIAPTMLPAQDLREYQNRLYGNSALTAGSPISLGTKVSASASTQPPVDNDHVAEGAEQFDEAYKVPEPATAASPKRERGKPAPGRARRTKEEIAEDEAADAADANAAQISTNPENRVGPEDGPEVQAQDAADEQAEVDASRDAEAPLTIEDLKMAMSEYVTKFDMSAAQEDGGNIFGDALGKPPGGEQYWKMSLAAAAGQETLKKAIAAWKAAAAADKRYVKAGG